MGLTLVAILTAALLLPGFIATIIFYHSGRTTEADPVMPSLGSSSGVAVIGAFTIAVHLVYSGLLWTVSLIPPCLPLPMADPYRAFDPAAAGIHNPGEVFSFFLGLGYLGLTACAVGAMFGAFIKASIHAPLFHGPLKGVLDKADGPNAFITAYVLTKIEHEGTLLGYEGPVASITRDEDRLPTRVILREARPFTMKIDGPRTTREEQGSPIDWLILSATDWHNISLRVYVIED